jgi:2-keto-4-pentenoate hydratase/2-oxohepta-3-ene-1,7-dioic acid hydratase in catechol pathway
MESPALPRMTARAGVASRSVGLNYDDHLEESGLKKPAYPEIFARFATSLIAHREPIRRPRESTALDYEAELAEGLLVEAHESDLSVASEVTQARVAEALKVGAETYEGELEMEFISKLSPPTR